MWYWSKVDLNGVPPAPGLGAFSRAPAPTGVPLMRSAASSVSPRFFLERRRQKTNPITPITMAPPTPTTTPMTTFLFDSERPPSESELESSLRPGALVASPAALVLTEVELMVVGTGVPLMVWTVVTTTTWEVVLGFEVVVAPVLVGPVVVESLVAVAEVEEGPSVVVVSELDDEEVDVGVVCDSEVDEVEVDSSEVVVGVSDSEDEEDEDVSEVDSGVDVAEGTELSDVTMSLISETTALCPEVTATRDREYSKNERLARRMMASSC